MKRVGILGGTFDPPHIGHLLMAEEARLKMSLDEIWWMPNYIPPHKEKESSTSNNDRADMVLEMVDLHDSYRLCSIELRRQGPSYTVETMEELREKYKDTDFYFIIGEDSLNTLDQWVESTRLKELVSFIVIPRPGYSHKQKVLSERITMTTGPTIDVSSTEIRETIRKGRFNRFLLTKEVYRLVKERQLYGGD